MAVKLNVRKATKPRELDLECLDDILDLEDLDDVDVDVEDEEETDEDFDYEADDVEIVDFDEDEDEEPEPAPVRRKPGKLAQTLRKKAKPIESAHDSDSIPEDSWEEFFFESCVEELADEEGDMDDGEGYYWRFTIYPEDIDNFEELRGLTTIDLIDPDGTGNSYHFRAY